MHRQGICGQGTDIPSRWQTDLSGRLRNCRDTGRTWSMNSASGSLRIPSGNRITRDGKCWTGDQSGGKIIGDNLYSSDAGRIEEGTHNGFTHGTIIKPNQAGTVSAVEKAVEVSQRFGQIVITSHRSISTESIFLAYLTVQGAWNIWRSDRYTQTIRRLCGWTS